MDRPSLLVDGEILLYGDVGDPWCWGDGFTVTDVAGALAEHGPGDVTVRINSGGGIAFDGVAIYSLFLAHDGAVTMVVDGIAASAASLILMAGAVREIREGAMVMIHDAAGVTFGTTADHQRAAGVLDKLSGQYAGIYAQRAGMEREAARDLMKAETWFSAAEAVAQGLCTGTLRDVAAPSASFDYRIYAHAPTGLPTRARPKPAPAASTPTAADPPVPPQETPVTTPAPTPPAPAPKAWATEFFAAAEASGLSVAALLGIVNGSETLEGASTALAAAVAKAAETAPEPAPPPASAKAWSTQFFAAAETSGLPIKDLNAIVARAPGLEAAKDALIDAMASAHNAGKPAPSAAPIGSPAGKDDKAERMLAAYRKAGGRTRTDATAR